MIDLFTGKKIEPTDSTPCPSPATPLPVTVNFDALNATLTPSEDYGEDIAIPGLPEPPPAKRLANNRRDRANEQIGKRDRQTGKYVFSTSRTLPTGEAFLEQFYQVATARSLVHYAGNFYAWANNRYAEVEAGYLEKQLLPWLHEALTLTRNQQGKYEQAPFPASPRSVSAVLETLRQLTHLPAVTTPPAWIDAAPGRPNAAELLPTPTGHLHLPTREILPGTPMLFATNGIDFNYNQSAGRPTRWLKFLGELWGDDQEQIDTLQDWFAYCLTGLTNQQKIMLIIGPKRSGKGTIARILQRLVGAANVAAPTVFGLAAAFGLQPLIGKSLAIVSDARFSGENIGTVVERLLCISGEDTLTVDRKFQTSITMKLSTRFIFLSNELPKMTDASGALAGRFVVLRIQESFYGREDTALLDALLAELPGILNWALDAIPRLEESGRFVSPASVANVIREIEDLASPVTAFTRDWCEVAPGNLITCAELFAAWKLWCKAQGRDHPGTMATLGKDLRAACPGIEHEQRMENYSRQYFWLGIKLSQKGDEERRLNVLGNYEP